MKNLLHLLLLLYSSGLFAQDDLLKMLEDSAPKKNELTTATFKGTRLINLHTIETAGKRTLDFRISHRFGDMNGGAYQFFGLDGGASIRLGLEYSYDGRLEFGLGRTSTQKMLDGFVKYRILRQTTNNSMPLSITYLGCMYYTLLKDPNKAITGIDLYDKTTNRMSYCNQIIIGRKFSERFSLQLAPTIIHYNIVLALSDKNDIYALAFAARYKFTRRAAFTAEYVWRLNNYTASKFYDSAGIGVDIETGGHIFQLHFVNSFGILENQFVPYTSTTWSNWGIRLGFNISRVFTI